MIFKFAGPIDFCSSPNALCTGIQFGFLSYAFAGAGVALIVGYLILIRLTKDSPIDKQQRYRRIYKIIATILAIIGAGILLWLLLQIGNLSNQANIAMKADQQANRTFIQSNAHKIYVPSTPVSRIGIYLNAYPDMPEIKEISLPTSHDGHRVKFTVKMGTKQTFNKSYYPNHKTIPAIKGFAAYYSEDAEELMLYGQDLEIVITSFGSNISKESLVKIASGMRLTNPTELLQAYNLYVEANPSIKTKNTPKTTCFLNCQ
jgi:hypothetical protein